MTPITRENVHEFAYSPKAVVGEQTTRRERRLMRAMLISTWIIGKLDKGKLLDTVDDDLFWLNMNLCEAEEAENDR